MIQTVKSTRDRIRKWDLRFLRLIKNEISTWSKDPSTKCGSAIVKNVNDMISTGYNGYAAGVDDDGTLHIREEKYPRTIHAEENAIIRAKCDLAGHTLYVYPLAPCGHCAALICQAGITRVVVVMPDDPDRKARWAESNSIAEDQFHKKGVEMVFYTEKELDR